MIYNNKNNNKNNKNKKKDDNDDIDCNSFVLNQRGSTRSRTMIYTNSNIFILFLLLLLSSFSCVVTGEEGEGRQGRHTTQEQQHIVPSSLSIRAGILHAPPFAIVSETQQEDDGGDTTRTKTRTRTTTTTNYQYSGFQIDLLESIKEFAAKDNVELNIELSPAPAQYGSAFDLVSNDCTNLTKQTAVAAGTERGDSSNIFSFPDDCNTFDLIVADFYATASRSMLADLTPTWLRSTISTVKYLDKTKMPDVTTMRQALESKQSVCLKGGTFYAGVLMEKFPLHDFVECNTIDDCLAALKNEDCALYADDELLLRFRSASDLSLEVTPESFRTEYIVWALRDDLPYSRWFKKWMYDANSDGIIDDLFSKYFQKELCPVGTAGESCELPCDPDNGRADRRGQCICISTKFTGDDCSITVPEELNLIPPFFLSLAWIMVSINGTFIAACGLWLFCHRKTAQVRISQPFFLCLVLIGCLISSLTILAMSQEDPGDGPVRACMAIPWLYSVGFSITFGTLFAKIRRVYLIFKSAANMRRHKVTFVETLAVTGAVLLLDIIVLTVWTFVDPLRWERTVVDEDQLGNSLESTGICTCEHWQAFTGTIGMLHLLLLGFACYLCYMSRDIPTQFSEGKYVSIAMFSNLQIFIVAVPVLFILGGNPDDSFFIRTVVIWMNDFVVVGLIFGNLFYHVHFTSNLRGGVVSATGSTPTTGAGGVGTTRKDDQNNVNMVISNAIQRFSSRQRERSSNYDRESRFGSRISNLRRSESYTPSVQGGSEYDFSERGTGTDLELSDRYRYNMELSDRYITNNGNENNHNNVNNFSIDNNTITSATVTTTASNTVATDNTNPTIPSPPPTTTTIPSTTTTTVTTNEILSSSSSPQPTISSMKKATTTAPQKRDKRSRETTTTRRTLSPNNRGRNNNNNGRTEHTGRSGSDDSIILQAPILEEPHNYKSEELSSAHHQEPPT